MHALPPSTYAGRHPLRHHVVEVRHDVRPGCRSTRLLAAADRSRTRPTCSRSRHTGYTTNLPLADVTDGKAWVVWEVDGAPLPAEHGGPARLLVPHLYFWKSAKWVSGLAPARPRRARVLGAQRLPRPRRPVARAALPGRLTVSVMLADGDGARHPRRDAHAPRRSASRSAPPPATAPGSTTSCASPRPTATPRRARTRSRRRRTGPAEIELTVERLDDGEVSTFLHDVVEVGDELEVRGPDRRLVRVGRRRRPALLVGGGSGVVPAHGDAAPGARHRSRPTSCASSCRCGRPTTSTTRPSSPVRTTTVVYTRQAPPSSTRPAGRLTADDLEPHLRDDATIYVCGSAPFTDAVGDLVLDLGVHAERVKVERFGPSG